MVQMRTPIRKGRRFFTCVAKSFKPAGFDKRDTYV